MEGALIAHLNLHRALTYWQDALDSSAQERQASDDIREGTTEDVLVKVLLVEVVEAHVE